MSVGLSVGLQNECRVGIKYHIFSSNQSRLKNDTYDLYLTLIIYE